MICALLNCRCGNSPRLVTRGAKRWYQCYVCGTAGPRAASIPEAIAGWNQDRERERTEA